MFRHSNGVDSRGNILHEICAKRIGYCASRCAHNLDRGAAEIRCPGKCHRSCNCSASKIDRDVVHIATIAERACVDSFPSGDNTLSICRHRDGEHRPWRIQREHWRIGIPLEHVDVGPCICDIAPRGSSSQRSVIRQCNLRDFISHITNHPVGLTLTKRIKHVDRAVVTGTQEDQCPGHDGGAVSGHFHRTCPVRKRTGRNLVLPQQRISALGSIPGQCLDEPTEFRYCDDCAISVQRNSRLRVGNLEFRFLYPSSTIQNPRIEFSIHDNG